MIRLTTQSTLESAPSQKTSPTCAHVSLRLQQILEAEEHTQAALIGTTSAAAGLKSQQTNFCSCAIGIYDVLQAAWPPSGSESDIM